MSERDGLGPVVLFGGGGFLGRQVAQELFKRGRRVRIAQRDPDAAIAVRSLGEVGSTQLVVADITKRAQVERALLGASAAVNLVGLLKGKMRAVHVDGARSIAEAATAAGLKALVQVSAIGADPESRAMYGRTKGEGEAAVRAAFPKATIIRPSILFGRDDQFTNRFARLISVGAAIPLLRVVPVIRGAARFQPVHVGDVARAIAMAIVEPAIYGGETYELGGPDILSLAQINHWIAEQTGRKPRFMAVPDGLAGLMASLTGWLPGAPITRDQFEMLRSDTIVAPTAKGFKAFAIAPAPMAALAPGWLASNRKAGRFGTPAISG